MKYFNEKTGFWGSETCQAIFREVSKELQVWLGLNKKERSNYTATAVRH